MRRYKKILLVIATVILILPAFLVTAESSDEDNKSEVGSTQKTGEISSKDEVVYAKLSAAGKRQEIYVVNILDIDKVGEVIDHGQYTNLKNLTDLSPIEQKNDTVTLSVPKGKFYYQGNMDDALLPWNINVSYLLDGEKIAPEDLAGKDGHVQIQISTSANSSMDPVFFENYLLQISFSLNMESFTNIQAPDGMLANAGKNKQVTFTVMPEKEEILVLEADVEGFELNGIDITGIPSSMPIDAPNINDMTGDMKTLSDAIEEVNNGVGELEDGVIELNNGVHSLVDGSKSYKDGMTAISDSSSEVVDGSSQINNALKTLSTSLKNNSEDMGLGDIEKLINGLLQMAEGFSQTSKDLDTLKGNYTTAYSTLNQAMEAIPEHEISEQQIQQLYGGVSDPDIANVVDQLLDTYSKALTAKGTYLAVKEVFDAVETTLGEMSDGLSETATELETMANGLSSSLEEMDIADSMGELQKGLGELSANYEEFHSGLMDYTDGVSQLSGSYGDLHSGIFDLSVGTDELEKGVDELHKGTSELSESTSDLPDQMKKEVDQMMDDYDKSDFDVVSFVSPKNDKINSVQFVFKTDSIKLPEKEETQELKTESKGFWARLLDLFK